MLRAGSLPSRAAAILLLLAALFAGYRLVVAPVIAAYQDAAQSISQSGELLQRYRALAAQREQLARRLEEQEQSALSSSAYLEGSSDALAAAALQEQVSTIIAAAQGELRSTQTLPARSIEEEPTVRQAGLRLDFAISIDGLQDVLYELETAEPYVFIDELSIREARVRRRRNEPAQEPLLDVSLTVYGYVRQAQS